MAEVGLIPSAIILFFLLVEKLGNKRPLDLQGALRAELLTAEAADAFFSVDDRFFILNDDRLGGTDAATDSASDAHIPDELRASHKHSARDPTEEAFHGIFSVARKLKRTALNDALKFF